MRYHFLPETGRLYWLAMKDRLGFDPRREVRTFEGLVRAFPIKPTSDYPWDGIEGLKGWSEDGEQAVTGVY